MAPIDSSVRPPFEPYPVLRGPSLTLREVLEADAGDVREFTVYDGVPALTDDEAAATLRRIHADYHRGEAVHWGICAAGTGRVVGTCGYYRGFDDQTGEIGYVLGAAWRGRGYMTEAVRLVVNFGFDAMGLENVVAYTDATNLPSIAVLRRCHFEEGAAEGDRLVFSLDRGKRSARLKAAEAP